MGLYALTTLLTLVGVFFGGVWLATPRVSPVVNAEPGGTVLSAAAPSTDDDAAATYAPPAPSVREVDSNAPAPTAVHLARLDIDAALVPLGVDERNRLEVPADPAIAGWWRGGPEPGEDGPAVITGHVDDYRGPGVFLLLHQAKAGDLITIDREDGSMLSYRVVRVEQHPKDDFPTQAVYGDTTGPTLRLVTCGGTFDRSSRSYRDNVVVFADLVDRTTPTNDRA